MADLSNVRRSGRTASAVIALWRTANGTLGSAGTVYFIPQEADDFGECGAILPEKLMAAVEHPHGCAWDSFHHTLLR